MLSIQLPPLEVFNATLFHELCLKYFSNLLWFTSYNRAYYTFWIHAWSLPQTVGLNSFLKYATPHFSWIFALNFPQIISPCFIYPQILSLKSDLKSPTNYFLHAWYLLKLFLLKLCLKFLSHKLHHPKPCMISPQFIPLNLCLKCPTNHIP